MPAVLASAVVAAVGLTGVAATVVSAAVGFAGSMAINALTSNGRRKSTAVSASERMEMVRSATAARRVIYGQARVSGPVAFAYTTNSATGLRNHLLHFVIPVAAHEVTEISALYVNDELFADTAGAQGWRVPPVGSKYINGKFNDGVTASPNLLQWRYASGAADQAADPFLLRDVPVWSVAHRLRGVAYVYARLYWDNSVWAAGLPNLSVVAKGRKVYDPRSQQTVWSDNPALCIRDYLLASFGMNCLSEEIDDDSFIAAANLCDELVRVADGSEQKRYTCNGVLALDQKPINIMEQLLSCCAGSLVYTQGRYKLYPAAYRTPQLSLDASMLRGAVKVRPQPPRRERANVVQGTFVDPARGWLGTEFPPVTSATYRAQDGGERIGKDLELAFTNNSYMAQRLAQLQLERGRRALVVELPCTMAALDVAVMEPVRLTLPQLGWVDKVFLPTEWTLASDGGIDLVLQEEDAQLYSWSGGVEEEAVPDVVLPDLIPQAPLLTLSDDEVGGVVRLLASISPLADALHSRFEVEYRRADESSFTSAGSGELVAISGVVAGERYEVRARAVNALGATSLWTSKSWQVQGSAQPPGDLASLIASLIDSTLYLEWAAPSGSVHHYRLRWSMLTSGAEWASAIDIASEITNLRAAVPARQGSYLIKAVDALGRESANAALYINRTADAQGRNVVASVSEHPAFSGSKSNCMVNASNQLIISSLSAFDAQSSAFDSATGNFDTAGGGSAAEGVYEFLAPFDLGARYVVRLSASVKVSVIDLVADFDGVAEEFDAREGNFDGSAPSAVDVLIEVAMTDADPLGVSPTWSSWQPLGVGDFIGRGFKLRARLVTSNPMATPALEQLTVQLDMPDRVAAASSLTSASGADTISFSPAFKAVPAISVTSANLASGDYAVISGKSRSGFTVQFKNSTGTGVSRTYDWVARGYGREQ